MYISNATRAEIVAPLKGSLAPKFESDSSQRSSQETDVKGDSIGLLTYVVCYAVLSVAASLYNWYMGSDAVSIADAAAGDLDLPLQQDIAVDVAGDAVEVAGE